MKNKTSTILRVLALALIMCSMVAMFTGSTMAVEEVQETAGEYAMGDVNHDGKVKANDARLVLRYSAELDVYQGETVETEDDSLPFGIKTYTNGKIFDPNLADIDGNGTIRANDARRILRVSADLESFVTEETTTEETTTEEMILVEDLDAPDTYDSYYETDYYGNDIIPNEIMGCTCEYCGRTDCPALMWRCDSTGGHWEIAASKKGLCDAYKTTYYRDHYYFCQYCGLPKGLGEGACLGPRLGAGTCDLCGQTLDRGECHHCVLDEPLSGNAKGGTVYYIYLDSIIGLYARWGIEVDESTADYAYQMIWAEKA